MKIKLYLIGLMACFLSVFSFAKSDAMSYYMVSPEKVEEYEKLDLQVQGLVFRKPSPNVRNHPAGTQGISAIQENRE